MRTNLITSILMIGLLLLSLPASHAQTAGHQDAINILKSLPPDLYAKIQELAQMLDQGVKSGKLTEAEIRQGMMSGHLGNKLKTVYPEAGHLLDEISDAMKSGKGPGEESLMPLLGGLGIPGQ